ncbi:MAG: hypothetical protein J0G30_12450 [Actinomycetales bacterium]|nr:hypothetical protein [Actinomycetales bacterium]
MVSLTRAEMIDGLVELIDLLRARDAHATIRIVGGAAVMLRYFEDRRITPDIDASIHTDVALDDLTRQIAARRGWPSDWLNDAAAGFIPFADPGNWEPVYDDDAISIWVATPPCLLAMKLRAARRGRDDEDVAILLALLGITTADEAERVFETHYPGELPPERAYRMLDDIFAVGLPPVPEAPELHLGGD